MIATSQIQQLPLYYQTTVTEAHLDVMGHLNVQWYMAFFDKAGWQFFSSLDMSELYFEQNQNGMFALQQYIYYYAELRLGETIAIHSRLLGYTQKRVHFMHFMLNQTRPGLAATLESLGSHANLAIRRTSPFPLEIAEQLKGLYQQHQAMDWEAPICGIMQA